MFQIILTIFTFILFQTFKSKTCSYQDEIQEVFINLSDQEIVFIPFKDYFQPPYLLSFCNLNSKNDVKLVDSIELFEQYDLKQKDFKINQVKQYKTSRNRMPQQNYLVIVTYSLVLVGKFIWGQNPEFSVIFNHLKQKFNSVNLIDNIVFLNFETSSDIIDISKQLPISLKTFNNLGCKYSENSDQLNDSIFMTDISNIYIHQNIQNQDICQAKKLQLECSIDNTQQNPIKKQIYNLKTYPDNLLIFNSQLILATIDLNQEIMICQEQQYAILAYDYDQIKKIFVVVSNSQLQYDGYTYELMFQEENLIIQVFLTKSFIIFRNKYQISLFTKKLNLIQTKYFEYEFEILVNQLLDQFILISLTHFNRYLLYENPFIQFNWEKILTTSFYLQIENQLTEQSVVFLAESHYSLNNGNVDLNKIKQVSTLKNGNIINFEECNYEQIKIDPKYFIQFNRILKAFSHQIRIFDFSGFKFLYAYSKSFIYLGLIQNGNLQNFRQYTIQDEIITKQNCAYQNQQMKINQVHCYNNRCYIYYDIMQNYNQDEILVIGQNQIQKVVSDNNHFYVLVSKQVLFFNLQKINQRKLENLDFKTNVKDIYASPKKEDFLFVLNEEGILSLYSISLPFQDWLSSFKVGQDQIEDFIIFEEYFLIFSNSSNSIVCKVYNYQNELRIFEQRTLPLYFFNEIFLDDLQIDYDQNLLFVKGQIKQSNQYAIVTYKIDSRIEFAFQFIAKVIDYSGFLLPISNQMILRFQTKFNFTSIYYNGDKHKICLITNFHENEDSFMDDEDSSSDMESDFDDTLSLDESYQFSPGSFISISSAGELLILGLQSVYSKKRRQVDANDFQLI
ncbi:unnamed protein product [Paramecium sonneborni]|uniref:Transmembrane protein n=1 Tax=Paramecium sonneborni TaxID=65129 RepID=A0A8S1R5T7_9CILI|nr:unnamed protein product [Paramecium sonneborni]